MFLLLAISIVEIDSWLVSRLIDDDDGVVDVLTGVGGDWIGGLS